MSIAKLLLPAFFIVAAIAGPAMAQEKAKPDAAKAIVKVLLENDKVQVYEAHIPVGAEAANIARPYRIGRALTNGTIQRIFADGKKETVQWKAGEVKELGPDTQYIPRNIGKTDFRIYVVVPKAK